MKETLTVKSNEFVFDIDKNAIEAADILQKSPNQFHLLHNNRSVAVTVLNAVTTGKKIKMEVNGESFDIEIKDELDQMLDKMGFNTAASRQIKEVKAPMPGLVLQVDVSEGQQVNEGDRLLILSAMKMENSITIQSKAVIKKINVVAGQAVEKGQVLVDLE